MLNDIFTWLSSLLSDSFLIALFGSFLWGLLSIILSPCHLSSIPLIIGYINKQGVPSAKKALNNSIIFALGILITIAAIGGVTAALGGIIGDIGTVGNYIVAVVFFAAGLYLLDIIKLDWNNAGIKQIKSKGYKMAFLLGLLFGIGLGPCTFAFMAPVLGAAFHYAATSIPNAVLLLLAFALGHCLVIASAGLISVKVGKYLKWSENSKGILILKKVCGILVILGGVYFLYLGFY